MVKWGLVFFGFICPFFPRAVRLVRRSCPGCSTQLQGRIQLFLSYRNLLLRGPSGPLGRRGSSTVDHGGTGEDSRQASPEAQGVNGGALEGVSKILLYECQLWEPKETSPLFPSRSQPLPPPTSAVHCGSQFPFSLHFAFFGPRNLILASVLAFHCSLPNHDVIYASLLRPFPPRILARTTSTRRMDYMPRCMAYAC